jgi:hypothetical protein
MAAAAVHLDAEVSDLQPYRGACGLDHRCHQVDENGVACAFLAA